MDEILNGFSENGRRRLSKQTIRLLIIAAALLIGTLSVFASPSGREFIIKRFSNHSEYSVADSKDAKIVKSLSLNYIPKGFYKINGEEDYCIYKNSNKEFIVEKFSLGATIGYDDESFDCEIIEINGIESVYHKSENNYQGIIFNNGEHIFTITGNIEKEELVKIAQNVE